MQISRISAPLGAYQMLPVLESGEETTLVGGQAVLEGVMMRAPHSYCVAVRKPDGQLVTEEQPLQRDVGKVSHLQVLRSCAGWGLWARP